jgi:hypothetical protein
MPSNSRLKAFPMRMPLQDYQALPAHLMAIRQELQAAGERLQTAYGKSDVKSRSLKRALAELDVLRGHCSYSLVHEQANGRGHVGSEKPFLAGADRPRGNRRGRRAGEPRG